MNEKQFENENDVLLIVGDSVLGVYTQKEIIEELVIPEGVRVITDFAFSGASDHPKIRKVIFPESMAEIGEGAFEYQDQLTDVHIGSNLGLIKDKAFYRCEKLVNVHLNQENLNHESMDVICRVFLETEWGNSDENSQNFFLHLKKPENNNNEAAAVENASDKYGKVVFERGKTIAGKPYVSLVRCPTGQYGVFRIPEGVDRFEIDAFDEAQISCVVFPGTMKFIPEGAFLGCDNIVRFVLPASITGIGDQGWENPFENCKNLLSVEVDVCNKHFYSVDGLLYNATGRLLCCPAGKTGEIKVPDFCGEIGAYAFSNSQASAITLPESIRIIASGAFTNCQKLTSISIPESVIGTYGYLFRQCTALKDVYLHTTKCVLENEYGDQFIDCPEDLCIHGKAGGDIEQYAKKNGFCFCELTDEEK